jgi:hypothetical protein
VAHAAAGVHSDTNAREVTRAWRGGTCSGQAHEVAARGTEAEAKRG